MRSGPCQGDPHPPEARTTSRVKKAAAIARSGARRYSRELLGSLKARIGPGVREAHAHGTSWASYESAPLAASWIGHATVLLRIGGLWAITDPVFSHRIGLKLGPLTLGVERLRPPNLRPEALPPLDLILISHAHFDHLDKPSLRQLVRDSTTVITSRNTARLIPRGFGRVREVHWDQSVQVGPVTIHALRPRHWGARTAWDRHRGYNSYLLEVRGGAAPARVLYAGDTAYTRAFERVGGADLSVFGIGAYDPWIHAHATPEEVWDMHRQAGAKYLLPIHHSTFKLSDEPLDEPLRRLVAAAGPEHARLVTAHGRKLWCPGEASGTMGR